MVARSPLVLPRLAVGRIVSVSNCVSRRGLLALGGIAFAGVGCAPPANADTPATALERLLSGNRRFMRGASRHPHQSVRHLRETAAGQHPFAVTIGCADSRVAPEILFDQGLGDLFDDRVAGNLVDELMLGSIEFAVEEFDAPLVVVLGHERCGAITATIEAIESGVRPAGHIGAIVDSLRPIVEPVLGRPGDHVDNAVRANIRAVMTQVLHTSEIVRTRVDRGQLAVVGARYDLDTGEVTLVT